MTAAPVPCLAVDNMLDGMVQGTLDKDDMEERRRRKAAWVANGAQISKSMRSIGQKPHWQAGSSGQATARHTQHLPDARGHVSYSGASLADQKGQ